MKFIRFWGPPIVWMALIFLLSSRRAVHISDQETINFIFFKTLHVFEYAILYLLYFRAFKNSILSKENLRYIHLVSFLYTVLYAVTDELHQNFVPTREGKLPDVIIDGIGASISWILLIHLLPRAPDKLKYWVKKLDIS